MACGGALSAMLRRLLCKSHLHLITLSTAPGVRRMVAAAVAAVRLSQRAGNTPDLGAPAREAPGSVSPVTLRMSKTLAALALQWALWSHITLHLHSQIAELGE
jgi:hypothetical protein